MQDFCRLKPIASLDDALREHPTDIGSVDYIPFIEGVPVGVVEAKRGTIGGSITAVE